MNTTCGISLIGRQSPAGLRWFCKGSISQRILNFSESRIFRSLQTSATWLRSSRTSCGFGWSVGEGRISVPIHVEHALCVSSLTHCKDHIALWFQIALSRSLALRPIVVCFAFHCQNTPPKAGEVPKFHYMQMWNVTFGSLCLVSDWKNSIWSTSNRASVVYGQWRCDGIHAHLNLCWISAPLFI